MQSTVTRVCSLVYDSYHHHYNHARFSPPTLHLDVDPNSLTHDQAVTIVASLASDAGSMVALSFFNWAIASSKFRHFTRLYIACAASLISNKNFEKAHEVMQCMVKSFAEIGRVKEAIEMVIEMHNQGLAPSTKTLNWVVKIVTEMGLVEYAENLFGEMCARGVQSNCVSYRSWLLVIVKWVMFWRRIGGWVR